MGLESGSMLLIGSDGFAGSPIKSEIWRLEKGNWSVIGNMKKVRRLKILVIDFLRGWPGHPQS